MKFSRGINTLAGPHKRMKYTNNFHKVELLPLFLSSSICFLLLRVPLPLPPPWTDHAGRPRASAPALRHLWWESYIFPGGLPQRQHRPGAAVLHPHHLARQLVLGGKSAWDPIETEAQIGGRSSLSNLPIRSQIGFVLYPPNGTVWDMKDHNTMMFITMCFSWHFVFAILVVGVVYGTVSW